MKRVLLASALATMALAASAQAQEVLRSSNGFDVIPKNLTASGKNVLYSSSGDKYSGNKTTTFTVYDENFVQTKTFSFTGNEFSYKTVHLKALAPITRKTFSRVAEDEPLRVGESDSITTKEQLVSLLNDLYGSGFTIDNCFTDREGNLACHSSLSEEWQGIRGQTEVDGNPAATISETYFYYNKEDNMVHRREDVFTAEFDVASLNWETDDSYSGGNDYNTTYCEDVESVEVKDFDNALCNDGWWPDISQTLFNNDDKYEYVVKSYREGAEPSNRNTNFNNGLTLGYDMQDGKLVIKKTAQDHYYNLYLYVADEDGNKLFDLPGLYDSDNYDREYGFKIFRLNGKTLFEALYYGSTSGKSSTGLYLYDPSTNGIQELARTQASPAKQLFNLQGMQVDGNAKGIVIQKGGRKYVNR